MGRKQTFYNVILALVILGVFLLVGYQRYHSLKTRFQITLFFRNASVCLTPFFYDEQQRRELDFFPENWKDLTTDLLPYLTDNYYEIEPKHRLDPFQEGRKLEVRYGIVRHPVEVKLDSGRYNPERHVFFTWSTGPSREVDQVEMRVASLEEGNEYRFQRMPYDISNGLWSSGYLFYDSHGVQFGRVD